MASLLAAMGRGWLLSLLLALLVLDAPTDAIRLSLRNHRRRLALTAEMLLESIDAASLTPSASATAPQNTASAPAPPAAPAAAATTANPTTPAAGTPNPKVAAGTNQFNDLTITHERDTHAKSLAPSSFTPAAAPSSNQFNDMTITHERDTHATATAPAASAESASTIAISAFNSAISTAQQAPAGPQSTGTNQFNDMTITHERDTHQHEKLMRAAKLAENAREEVNEMVDKADRDALQSTAEDGADDEETSNGQSEEDSTDEASDNLPMSFADSSLKEDGVVEDLDHEGSKAEESETEGSSESSAEDAELELSAAAAVAADHHHHSHSKRRIHSAISGREHHHQPNTHGRRGHNKGAHSLRVDADHDGASSSTYNDMTVASSSATY